MDYWPMLSSVFHSAKAITYAIVVRGDINSENATSNVIVCSFFSELRQCEIVEASRPHVNYDFIYKIHKVLGEGNFVLTVSEGEWNGTNNVFYDLLRFENGKAVEHWDVIQPIPTEGLAHNNGMFGF